MCKAVIFEGFLHENIEIPCVLTNFIHFRNPSLGISILSHAHALYASIGWKESYAVGNFEGIIIEAKY